MAGLLRVPSHEACAHTDPPPLPPTPLQINPQIATAEIVAGGRPRHEIQRCIKVLGWACSRSSMPDACVCAFVCVRHVCNWSSCPRSAAALCRRPRSARATRWRAATAAGAWTRRRSCTASTASQTTTRISCSTETPWTGAGRLLPASLNRCLLPCASLAPLCLLAASLLLPRRLPSETGPVLLLFSTLIAQHDRLPEGLLPAGLRRARLLAGHPGRQPGRAPHAQPRAAGARRGREEAAGSRRAREGLSLLVWHDARPFTAPSPSDLLLSSLDCPAVPPSCHAVQLRPAVADPLARDEPRGEWDAVRSAPGCARLRLLAHACRCCVPEPSTQRAVSACICIPPSSLPLRRCSSCGI